MNCILYPPAKRFLVARDGERVLAVLAGGVDGCLWFTKSVSAEAYLTSKVIRPNDLLVCMFRPD